MKFVVGFVLILLCSLTAVAQPFAEKIKGLSFVSPPEPFQADPFHPIKKINANWIAVIPYAYSRNGKPDTRYESLDWQWWGEKVEGIKVILDLARQNGVKVMLKPSVYISGGWTGDVSFKNDADWEKWEAGYEKYILMYAELAEAYQVEMFCVGNEFKLSVKHRLPFWRKMIEKVRCIYGGPLTYAANWDAYEQNDIWEEVDYIGINAYFPLLKDSIPSIASLCEKWEPISEKIAHESKTYGKNVIFTEIGYLSVEGCAHNTWEKEKIIDSLAKSELAQANAYEAFLTTFMKYSWWQGSFIWKWFPNNRGHEGYFDKDYTPQHKKAEKVLSKWFVD